MPTEDVISPLWFNPVSGPDVRPIEFMPGAITRIGRSGDNEVRLDDNDISLLHALISSRSNAWFVTDLGSDRPARLNGHELNPHEPTPLAPGDLLRIGPWTWRMSLGPLAPAAVPTLDDLADTARRLEVIDPASQRWATESRLAILLDCANQANTARDESELAVAVLHAALEGTGFSRGALLRRSHDDSEVEVIGSIAHHAPAVAETGISRSLLRQASTGRVARLRADSSTTGPQAALCTPIEIDFSVIAYLYLDSRKGEPAERQDAADFCLAVSRIAGLALANLKRTEAQTRQRVLEAQFAAAREAQELILPPRLGVAGRLAYALQTRPGLIVAGDLFDAILLPDDHVGICFGDVTGEGIGAGLLMASTQAHLHASLIQTRDPAEAARQVNRYLVKHSAPNRFVTLWVGVFDPGSGTLRYVDAGHGHWLIIEPGSPHVRHPAPGDIPVGIDEGRTFVAQELRPAPGSRIVLYSDGIIEQRSPKREEFGLDRVIEVLSRSNSAHEDAALLLTEVTSFAQTTSLNDDATVASIEIRG